MNKKMILAAGAAALVLIFLVVRSLFPGSGAVTSPEAGESPAGSPTGELDSSDGFVPITLQPGPEELSAGWPDEIRAELDFSAAGATVLLLEELASSGAAARSERIQELLDSDNPLARAAGMVAALEFDLVGIKEIEMLAEDETLGVPLSVLGWMRDTGMEERRAVLESALEGRDDFTEASLRGALMDRATDEGAGRAALDLLQGGMENEAAAELFLELAENSQVGSGVRFEAALRLAEAVELEELPALLKGLTGFGTLDSPAPVAPVAQGRGSQQGPEGAPDFSGPPGAGSQGSVSPLLDVLHDKYAAPPPVLESKGLGMSRGDARLVAVRTGASSFDALASMAEQSLRTGSTIEPGLADTVEDHIAEAYDNPTGELEASRKRGERRLRQLLPGIREAEERYSGSGFGREVPPGAQP